MAFENRFFPHLLPQDIEVWKRYLTEHEHEFDSIVYDLRVGDGRDPGPDFADNIRSMAIGLSQRRIDAIGFKGNNVTIIEVTTRAGLTAIGQLKVYPVLYKALNPTVGTITPLLVAERLQDDILPYLLDSGIKFLLYPE